MKLLEFIKNPKLIIRHFKLKRLYGKYGRSLSDEEYLKQMYKLRVGKELDLENPKTFNEKLQWLKLHDRNPEYTKLVDKYEVKKYVADIIGEEYIVPTLGVYNSFDEIDFNSLPNQFVIKCTHDSGGLVIVKDKNLLDIKKSRKKIQTALNNNYYYLGREWPYKGVSPRILIEECLNDDSGEIVDYKFFCFDGKCQFMFVAIDRGSEKEETKFNFYDRDFNLMPFVNGHPNAIKEIIKPSGFDKMKELAEILSSGMTHARVDFYCVNNKIYFGEITLYHWSGLVPFQPEEWDRKLGDLIKLPTDK